MHLHWYGYEPKKEHEDFEQELIKICEEMSIEVPKILDFGVEDSVVGMYALDGYGVVGWYGNGRDKLKEQLIQNIQWNKEYEIQVEQARLKKEVEFNRLNSLSRRELKSQIKSLKLKCKSTKPKKQIKHKNEFEKILEMLENSIQTPEKVGSALKTISNRLKLVELEEFYNSKFGKAY